MRRAVAGGAGGEVFLAKLCSRFAAEGLTLKNSYAGFFLGVRGFTPLITFAWMSRQPEVGYLWREKGNSARRECGADRHESSSRRRRSR